MVSKKALGIALIAFGIALPAIAYMAGRILNMEVASYGGPPNQGAMVLAYLVIQGAFIVGAVLVLAGLLLHITAPRKPIDARIKNVP